MTLDEKKLYKKCYDLLKEMLRLAKHQWKEDNPDWDKMRKLNRKFSDFYGELEGSVGRTEIMGLLDTARNNCLTAIQKHIPGYPKEENLEFRKTSLEKARECFHKLPKPE